VAVSPSPARSGVTGDRIERRWTADLGDYVTVTAASPAGDLLLAASLSGRAALLDIASGRLTAELPSHPFGVLAGAWSRDGRWLATAGQDDRLRLHAVTDATAGCSSGVEVPLDGWGATLAWSPADELVAVGAGRTVSVHQPDGSVIGRWSDLPSTVTAVAWSIDGISVGATCYGGVHWFRPATPTKAPRHFVWKGSLLSLVPSPDGKWAAAGCQDASIHLWRLWSGKDLEMSGYPAKIEHLAWHRSSRYLAVGGVGDVTVWDFAGRGPRGTRPVTLDGHTRHVTAVEFEPTGDRLVSADAAGDLHLWSPPKRTTPVGHLQLPAGIAGVAWRHDGSGLYVGGADGTVTAAEIAAR
jgi:WD40 repeat protein